MKHFREYEPDSFSSVTIKRADEDSSDEEDNNDLKSFVTSSSVDDYSEYGKIQILICRRSGQT